MSETSAEVIPWNTTLEQCHEAILKCLLMGPGGLYQIGLLYNHIVEYRLAVKRGYSTTRAYFRRHVRVFSHATLTMCGAVAKTFYRDTCEKYGAANLGALLEYLRLARTQLEGEEHKDPGQVPIEVSRRNGLRIIKPFGDCTAEDLREAIEARRAWPGPGPLEPDEEPLREYMKALGKYFKDHSRSPPEVDGYVHNRRGHLRIRHLRLWDLAKLTEALKATGQPVAAVAAPAEQPVVLARTFN